MSLRVYKACCSVYLWSNLVISRVPLSSIRTKLYVLQLLMSK